MRIAACCLVAVAAQATFSVHTDMVVLPVTVTDARGHSVAGLTPADFHVYDDGQPRAIALFQSGEVPVTVGLIVDRSQSMGSKSIAINASIVAFGRQGRADDELFVVGFSDRVHVLPLAAGKRFTADPAEIAAALQAERAGGATALYDAVAEGLRGLAFGHTGRKALIVVSDGGDNASHLKYDEVRDLARRSDAVIYGIGLLGADTEDENPDTLKRLCRENGGTAYFPDAADISNAFERIEQDLRNQYTIGFEPGGKAAGFEPGGKPVAHDFHAIKVTALGPAGTALRVRTRAGYSVSGPKR